MLLESVSKIIRRPNDQNFYKSLVKNLHDDSIRSCVKITGQPLLVEGLNHQQIWQQVSRHLNTQLTIWNSFTSKAQKIITFEEAQKLMPETQKVQELEDDPIDDEDEMRGVQQQQNESDQYEEEAINQQALEYNQQEEQMDTEERLLEEKMLELEGDQDVGLYGDMLDEDEDDDGEQNPLDADDEQEMLLELDGKIKSQKSKRKMKDRDRQENDDDIEDENFQHFREVEMENQQLQEEQGQQQQNEADVPNEADQITKLQKKLILQKTWELKGQVNSRDRPVNSLIETNLQFKRGVKMDQEITEEYNSEIENIVKKRILDQLFDDRVRFQFDPGFKQRFTVLPDISTEKNKQSLGEIYEEDFKNSMGLKHTKQQRQKEEIMALFKELNYKLDCLTNFNFVLKPVLKQAKVTQQPFILREEKIPLAMSAPGIADVQKITSQLKSDKELIRTDRQAKRLKNKRLGRQRKKEKEAKKMNRAIEYGGQTKFEADARKKIQRNKVIAKKVKYSQSGQFFKELQKNTGSKNSKKPNPDINKLRI